MNEIELKKLLGKNNSKSYVSMIKRRPKLLEFVTDLSSNLNTKSIAETLYCFTYSLQPSKCACGANALFNTYVKGYRKFCSLTCPSKGKEHSKKLVNWHNSLNFEQKEQLVTNAKQTFVKNYGVDNPMKSAEILAATQKKSLLQYGVKSNIERVDVKEKCKKINLERYGVETPLESTFIQQKGKDTTIERYGKLMTQARTAMLEKYNGKNPFEVEEVKEKLRQTMTTRYNRVSPKQFHLSDYQVGILTNKELFTELVSGKTMAQSAVDLDVSESAIGNRVREYGIRSLIAPPNRSQHESKIEQLLLELNVKYIRGSKEIISPLELDFYLPDFNIAFEVGSIFWHSELNAGREQEYHFSKWKQCKDKGITLFQWFDDELLGRWNVIKSKIEYLTGKKQKVIGAARSRLEFRNIDGRDFQAYGFDQNAVMNRITNV